MDSAWPAGAREVAQVVDRLKDSHDDDLPATGDGRFGEPFLPVARPP